MQTVVRPVIVTGSILLLTLAVGWLVGLTLRRAESRHQDTPLWRLLRKSRTPLQLVLGDGLLIGSFGATRLGHGHENGIQRALSLILIGSVAWLLVRVATAIVESGYTHYAAASHDPARVRRVRTQVTLIRRVVTAAVGVVAIAVMLLQFPAMRGLGTSVLASAGVVAAVAGIAAQSTLGNLFAGLQIAFGDMVRIGDTVVVDEEWGTVEEITLTYLVLLTWDERRITMPVSYFVSKPFENWSRGGAQLTGTVFLHLDHATPLDELRGRLHRMLKECDAWDGRAWSLVVTDTTPTTIEVRALATAKDADDVWTLRCTIREVLLDWLRRHHPYALPRVNTAQAPGLFAAAGRAPNEGPAPEDVGPGPGSPVPGPDADHVAGERRGP